MEFDASRFEDFKLDISKAYEDDGVLVFRGMFSDAEVDNFIAQHQSRIDLSKHWAESYLPSRLSFKEDSSITDLLCSPKITQIFDMFHPPIYEATRNCEEAYVLHTAEARLGSSTIAWHRDVIVPVEGMPKYIVVSIALSDSEDGSGRIAYIPGSHKWDVDYDAIPAEQIKENSHIGFAYYNELIEKMGVIPLRFEAKRGDVLIWNGYIIHQGDKGKDGAMRHTLTGHFHVNWRHPLMGA